jgi:hypothetical protein
MIDGVNRMYNGSNFGNDQQTQTTTEQTEEHGIILPDQYNSMAQFLDPNQVLSSPLNPSNRGISGLNYIDAELIYASTPFVPQQHNTSFSSVEELKGIQEINNWDSPYFFELPQDSGVMQPQPFGLSFPENQFSINGWDNSKTDTMPAASAPYFPPSQENPILSSVLNEDRLEKASDNKRKSKSVAKIGLIQRTDIDIKGKAATSGDLNNMSEKMMNFKLLLSFLLEFPLGEVGSGYQKSPYLDKAQNCSNFLANYAAMAVISAKLDEYIEQAKTEATWLSSHPSDLPEDPNDTRGSHCASRKRARDGIYLQIALAAEKLYSSKDDTELNKLPTKLKRTHSKKQLIPIELSEEEQRTIRMERNKLCSKNTRIKNNQTVEDIKAKVNNWRKEFFLDQPVESSATRKPLLVSRHAPKVSQQQAIQEQNPRLKSKSTVSKAKRD